MWHGRRVALRDLELESKTTLRSQRPGRAGRSPSARLTVLCAAAVVTALTAAAAAQSATTQRLESPRLAEISRAGGPIPDTLLQTAPTSALAPNGFWGGEYHTSSGENVTVYASNSYPVDPALGQRWADFLATLQHGSELSSVTLLLAPPLQITRFCGWEALACYSAEGSLLYAPGEDPSSDFSAEAVVTHEYGHHVAAHRSNAPWRAIDWGPKRWASSMQVCAKARIGQLIPGAEDSLQYELNPGEGWAETYRVLNERRLGVPEPPWEIVSQSLYPTDAALAAAEQDVTTAWQTETTSVRTAALSRTTRTRRYTFATPLDGTLKVTLRPSAGLRAALDVYAGSARVTHAVSARAFSRTSTICGARSYTIRVTEVGGKGSFRLTVAKP